MDLGENKLNCNLVPLVQYKSLVKLQIDSNLFSEYEQLEPLVSFPHISRGASLL